MSKWDIKLSTTEPHNNIGLIKVRMDNTNETFRVHVTENGQPYDLQANGITRVFFNTKFERFNSVQNEGVIVNASKGLIEYTLTNNDMQQSNAIQLAYFEFRKDDEHVAATQTFGYHIMKSIYKECTDGTTYIVRLEELFELYQDFMNQQSKDWELFVNNNREILESIDPGGKILSELIDARYSEFHDKQFNSLKERLDFIDSKYYYLNSFSYSTIRSLHTSELTSNFEITFISETTNYDKYYPVVIAEIGNSDSTERFKTNVLSAI